MEGFHEHGNESSGTMKGGEFFDQLSDCWYLKKDSGRCVTDSKC